MKITTLTFTFWLLTWKDGKCQQYHPKAYVSRIEVNRVSSRGGLLIIHGDHFALDGFNAFNKTLGNKVYFENDIERVQCLYPVEKTWLLQDPQAASTKRFTCFLQPRANYQIGSPWFRLTLTVDSLLVQNSRRHYVLFEGWRTPSVTGILTNNYIRVQSQVTFKGKIFSKLYGNAGEANDTLDRENNDISITGVFLGVNQERECSLIDDNGVLYGIYRDNDGKSQYGNMTCAQKGTFVGPMLIEFFVSHYGRSYTDKRDVLIDSKGQPYLVHTLAEVESVDKKSGGTNGGQLLKITGTGFDRTSTKVKIGNKECKVEDVTDTEIKCRAPSLHGQSKEPLRSGPAGMKYEVWENTGVIKTGSDPLSETLTKLGSPSHTINVDGMLEISKDNLKDINGVVANLTRNFTAVLSGFYLAPYSGNFKFRIGTRGEASVYVAILGNPANATRVIHCSRQTNRERKCTSDDYMMTKGLEYYVAVVYNREPHRTDQVLLRMGMLIFQTNLKPIEADWSRGDRQYVHIREHKSHETQEITFNGSSIPKTVRFLLGNRVSLFEFETDDNSKWRNNLLNLSSPACTYQPDDPNSISAVFQQAERPKNGDTSLSGQNGHHVIDGRFEAYCGRGLMEWNTQLYGSSKYIQLSKYPYACLAYKGKGYKYFQVHIRFRRNRDNRLIHSWRDLQVGLDGSDTEWKYGCYNISKYVEATYPVGYVKEDSIEMSHFRLPHPWNGQSPQIPYQIDEFRIASQPVKVKRIDSGLPDNSMTLTDVKVENKTVDGSVQEVKFISKSCDDKHIGLIGIAGAKLEEINSTDLQAIREYLANSSNNVATFSSPGWGAGVITVRRKLANSLKRTGSWALHYGDQTVNNLDPYIGYLDLQTILHNKLGLTGMEVGWWGDCASPNYAFYFKYDGGAKQAFIPNITNMIAPEGATLHSSLNRGEIGHLDIQRMGPDFYQRPEAKDQIKVTVNGYISWCKDCTYSYDPSMDTTATLVTQSTDASGVTTITVTGTGFTSPNDTTVEVGDEKDLCTIISVTGTEIRCSLPKIPAGTYNLKMYINSKSEVQSGNSSLEATIGLEVTAISPTQGGTSGGTTLTIDGRGFPTSMDLIANSTVVINGQSCKVKTTMYNKITCITPDNNGNGTYPAVVTVNGQTDSSKQFTFSSALTTKVTSISPASSNVLGGNILTITGTTLGLNGRVYIGETLCEILTWSSSMITCKLPSNKPGQYKVKVVPTGAEPAANSAASEINYDFKVTGIIPKSGSSLGGTKVQISGSGFVCDQLKVEIGKTFTCKVHSCDSTAITCTLTRITRTHIIRNNGTDGRFGKGFKFDPQHVKIAPWDVVEWRWDLSINSAETGINVMEADSAISKEYNGIGYRSGDISPSGRFRHTFTGLGVSYFTSDPVRRASELIMGGSVTSDLPNDEELMVNVQIGGIYAEHQKPGSVQVARSTGLDSSCPDLDTSSCTTGLSYSNSSITYRTLKCLTPIITSWDITEGKISNKTGNTVPSLSFNGTSFGTQTCQNRIIVGDADCNVETSSASHTTCKVMDNQELKPSSSHILTLSVQNHGLAAFSGINEGRYNPVPTINSVLNTEGSFGGGTVLTFNGYGLKIKGESNQVLFQDSFGGSPKTCEILTNTFTKLECKTPEYSLQDEMVATVYVLIGSQKKQPHWPKLNVTNPHRPSFTYKKALTAQVNSLSTQSLNSSGGNLIVNGSNFGTIPAAISVHLIPSRSGLNERCLVQRSSLTDEQREAFEPRVDKNPELAQFFDKYMKANQHLEEIRWEHGGTSSEEIMPSFHRRDIHDETYGTGQRLVFEDDYEMTDEEMEDEDLHFFIHERKRSVIERSLLDKRTEMDILTETVHVGCRNADDSIKATGTVVSLNGSLLEVSFSSVPAGSYKVAVTKAGAGDAIPSATPLVITGDVSSVTPAIGSVYGGQEITITGSGFSVEDGWTSVYIGNRACVLKDVTFNEIICKTTSNSGAEAQVNVTVAVNGQELPPKPYHFSSSKTPQVISVGPAIITGGGTVTINGTNLSAASMIKLGNVICVKLTNTDTQITCTAGGQPGGLSYEVMVETDDGYSNSDISVMYALEVNRSTPSEGSMGGGVKLTITGKGFDTTDNSNVEVLLCGIPCKNVIATSNQLTCTAPKYTGSNNMTDIACNISVSQLNASPVILQNSFIYKSSLTPQLSSISPNSGGSGGGTVLTITGSGFAPTNGSPITDVKITIDGSQCIVNNATITSSQIQCTTSSHKGAGYFSLEVSVPGKGKSIATSMGSDQYRYVDRWSSKFTWGGAGIPVKGSFVVIKKGDIVTLDVSTPVLNFLLIKGGTLVVDPEAMDVVLNSEYILILEDGKLEVGSEDKPHMNKATIMLHGHVRCTELPIYGCKVLGVRHGKLELHGRPIMNTWSYLSNTVEAGATSITLKHNISDWRVGDEFAIASTGHRNAQGENEKRTISSISGNTISFKEPLKYRHISISQTFGSKTIETRAEVGLLTRNIKVMGNVNKDFLHTIPACEREFQSGQFKTQSCFNGKFGEELGSDEFGATLLINSKNKDTFEAQARLSYVEFFWVGQAFRVGRYPIHFHLLGNVNGSYVEGCAVHNSFNRATTIHGVSNLKVLRNVVFDIKGLSFFIEDGIEEDNAVMYNLAIYTKQSSSLLNPDITPASYWIVNPNNKIAHNAAAGGTHFGYWYRIQRHPDGPSTTTSYCSNNVPLGVFKNNTAHTFGWYGLWVFSMAGYFPKDGTKDRGYCNGQNDIPARYEDFTAWRCERGAEVVFGTRIQFINFNMLDNEKSGLDFVEVKGPVGDEGPGVFNSTVVGSSLASDNEYCTHAGVFGPKLYGITIDNTDFHNFNRDGCYALSTCSQCKAFTAGFPSYTKKLSFNNSPNKITWKWKNSGAFVDMDGTLTGKANNTVLPKVGFYPPDACTDGGKSMSGGIPGVICDDTIKIGRVGLNLPKPESLLFEDIIITNKRAGSDRVFWTKKDITHPQGWSALLPINTHYNFTWANAPALTNISYKLSAWNLKDLGNYIVIQHDMNQIPDGFKVLCSDSPMRLNDSLPAMPNSTSSNGEWHWNNDTKVMSYVLAARTKNSLTARGVGVTSFSQTSPLEDERRACPNVYRCYFTGCIKPVPPTLPPSGIPGKQYFWSKPADWVALGLNAAPAPGADLVMPKGSYTLVIDVPEVTLGTVYVNDGAALVVPDDGDHIIHATHIYIQNGVFKAGLTKDAEFKNNLTINLLGDPDTYDFPVNTGEERATVQGAKSIGVFGGLLELKGKDVGIAWSKLNDSAEKGATTLKLANAVTWKVGDEIVITTSSYISEETETRTISSISNSGGISVITVDKPLEASHRGHSYTIDSKVYTFASEVGLLTRNIKIVGASYATQTADEFGCRVLISKRIDDGVESRGQAKLSNVEFNKCGQKGFVEDYDPRFSLAFLRAGDSSTTSYVKKCSFNMNYNTAIGIFDTKGLTVEDNVVYRAVGEGVVDKGDSSKWIGNLVSRAIFVGILHDNPRSQFFRHCFHMGDSKNIIFKDNVAAGCDRGGMLVPGEECGARTWENNEVHGTIHGVRLHTLGTHVSGTCVSLNGFKSWRAYDFAYYSSISVDVELWNSVSADSRNGYLGLPGGPSSSGHMYRDLVWKISDSVFIGHTDDANCGLTAPEGLKFKPGNFPHTSNIENSGILFLTYGQNSIKYPIPKKWADPMSYNGIKGHLEIDSITFVNFNNKCGKKNPTVRTNPNYEDLLLPIYAKNLKYINVAEDSKLHLDPPSLGKINPSDCVDMPCDAMKKCIIVDMDGSFTETGTEGTIISDTSFQWDGDRRYGTGDYRIPITARTNKDGTPIDINTKMPRKGITQANGQCTKNTDWNAIKCTGVDQRLLVIESLDPDTEDRRLSPIAVISDGYVDLINGPQDHGWCFGYTCQQRLSLFHAAVAVNRTHEIHMASTPPEKLRFMLLPSPEKELDETILVKFFYPKSQRYDVYVNGRLVEANNAERPNGKYSLKKPDPSYVPILDGNNMNGENYFDPGTNFLWLVVRGGDPIEVRTMPVAVLKFGGTVDHADFFDNPDTVVNNIADFLGIDRSMIIVSDIVREGRRKRSLEERSNTFSMTLLIANQPFNETETTASNTTTTPEAKAADPEYTKNFEAVSNAASSLANVQQQGKSLPGMKVEEMAVQELPMKPRVGIVVNVTEDTVQETSGTLRSEVVALEEKKELDIVNEVRQLLKPSVMKTNMDAIGSKEFKEMVKFPLDFQAYFEDSEGTFIKSLGTPERPWIVTVQVTSGPGNLVGTQSKPVDVDGFSTFNDLRLSTTGSGYTLRFFISDPANVTLSTNVSLPEVKPRPVSIRFTQMTNVEPQQTPFRKPVTVSLWDDALNQKAAPTLVPDNVTCSLELEDSSLIKGIVSQPMSKLTGDATWNNITIDKVSENHRFMVRCTIGDNGTVVGETTSNSFIIHTFPGMSHLRKLSMGFKYTGMRDYIEDAIDAFNKLVVDGQDTVMINPLSGGVSPKGFSVVSISQLKDVMKSSPICILGSGGSC